MISAKNALKRLANKKKAAVLQRFFKTGPGEYAEGDRFLGVTVPKIRMLVKQFHHIGIQEVARLLRSSIHEERLLALLILIEKYKKASAQEQKRIYDVYMRHTTYINNWDLIDLSAGHIVGAFLADKSKKPLYILARSKILWERRIAILSTFYYIKQHSFKDSLKIAKILLLDKEDLIHKAVGWMLREIGKRDQAIEEHFLKQCYAKMPRTMLRYAIERFPEPRRKAYLQGSA
ncbi:DNA alkylation repair protein [Candidatus Omnitrophota bacterium]